MSRISPGTVIIGMFALLFGLVGAYEVRQYLQPKPTPKPPAARREAPAYVPLASIDVAPGKTLSLGDIMLVPMTGEEIKQRALAPDYMNNAQQIIGRILRVPMKKGEPFLTSNLYAEGTGPSVAGRLRPGYRAVTVPIENVGAVAGFAGAGDMVDVLFRTKSGQDLPETTVALLEGVEVLALGERTLPGSRANGKETTVTLAVTAQQVAALKVVEGRGELSLAIRNPDDVSAASNSGHLTLEELLNLPKKQKPFVAEIYRAGSRQTVTFESEHVVKEQVGGVAATQAAPAAPVRKVGASALAKDLADTNPSTTP